MDPVLVSSVNGDIHPNMRRCCYSHSHSHSHSTAAESAPYSASLCSSAFPSSYSDSDYSVTKDGSYVAPGVPSSSSIAPSEASPSPSSSKSLSRKFSRKSSKKHRQRINSHSNSATSTSVMCCSKSPLSDAHRKRTKFRSSKSQRRKHKDAFVEEDDDDDEDEDLSVEGDEEDSFYYGMGHQRNSRNPSMAQCSTDLHSRPYEEYQKGSKVAQVRRWFSKFSFRSMWCIVRNLFRSSNSNKSSKQKHGNDDAGAVAALHSAPNFHEREAPYRERAVNNF